jgi:hypothetical protein
VTSSHLIKPACCCSASKNAAPSKQGEAGTERSLRIRMPLRTPPKPSALLGTDSRDASQALLGVIGACRLQTLSKRNKGLRAHHETRAAAIRHPPTVGVVSRRAARHGERCEVGVGEIERRHGAMVARTPAHRLASAPRTRGLYKHPNVVN